MIINNASFVRRTEIFNYRPDIFIVSGFNDQILLGALFTFFICLFINVKIFNLTTSFIVSFIKSFLPFFYFSFFYQGRFHQLSDDTKYIDFSQQFLNSVISNLNHGAAIDFYGVWHLFTTLFFSTSFLIYGNSYWAPIYLSVIFSCLTSMIIFNLFRTEIGKKNSQYFTLFYTLGLYTLVWTSIVALRESLCALLTILFLKMTWELIVRSTKVNIYNLGFFIIIFFVLINVRFYMPLFIFASTLIYFLVIQVTKFHKIKLKVNKFSFIYKILGFSAVLSVFLYLFNFFGGVPFSELYSLGEVPMRFLSITFGPLPSRLSNEYIFLTTAAYFHVIVFPLSLFYIVPFLKQSNFNKFLFINLLFSLIALSFFGLNIRHRFQYEFIIYFIEFFMFYKLAENGVVKIKLR